MANTEYLATRNRVLFSLGGLLALAILTTLPACQPTPKVEPVVESIVTVNGEAVPAAKFERMLQRLRSDLSEWPIVEKKALDDYKRRALRELIEITLLKQAAFARGITVGPDEIQSYLDRLHEGTDDTRRTRLLREAYRTDAEWKNSISEQVLVNKAIASIFASDVSVSEEALHNHYQEHFAVANTKGLIKLQQIVVPDQAFAQDLRARLMRDPGSFEQLAAEHSIAPEGPQGGIVGWVDKDSLPKEFAPAFSLPLGQISKVYKTSYGFHVFRVLEIQDARNQTYEKVRGPVEQSLRQALLDEAYTQGMAELMAAATIEVNQKVLEKFIQ